jgi:hypothetical protein
MLLIETDSVREFLRAILPTEAHFPAEVWIFRGQADDRWGLTPSIRRASSWIPLGGADHFDLREDQGVVVNPESELQVAEARVLGVLSRIIDRVGLDPSLKNDGNLAAFAQHIGLPTRLLDWTRAPMMAAYFAAAEAARKPPDPERRLVVYGMSEIFLCRHHAEVAKVERLVVPGAANPNMVAQQGEFIKVVDEVDLLRNVTRTRVSMGQPLGPIQGCLVDNHLIAVTLPWAHAIQLLRTLRDQGIHAASVYPGQYGVAELARELLSEPYG